MQMSLAEKLKIMVNERENWNELSGYHDVIDDEELWDKVSKQLNGDKTEKSKWKRNRFKKKCKELDEKGTKKFNHTVTLDELMIAFKFAPIKPELTLS